MALATVAAYKETIANGYAAFEAELKQAGSNWTTKPTGSADGEAAWCAREVAEHIIGSAGFFGVGIARAIGVDGPGRTGGEFATADEALAALPGAHARLMAIVDQVKDSQVASEMEFGPLGKRTLGDILDILGHHLHDHANQLRALRTT